MPKRNFYVRCATQKISFRVLQITRLSSVESQPKKGVLDVVVIVDVVVIIFVLKNLTLKFGQNWVNNKEYIVLVVFIVLFLLLLSDSG